MQHRLLGRNSAYPLIYFEYQFEEQNGYPAVYLRIRRAELIETSIFGSRSSSQGLGQISTQITFKSTKMCCSPYNM